MCNVKVIMILMKMSMSNINNVLINVILMTNVCVLD